MTILAVDNNLPRLWRLVQQLRKASPNATIEYTHDPMMAGRFGYNKPVDALFAALNMQRGDGMWLADFLRKPNPDMKVFLVADQNDWDTYAPAVDDRIEKRLIYPIEEVELREITAKYLRSAEKAM